MRFLAISSVVTILTFSIVCTVYGQNDDCNGLDYIIRSSDNFEFVLSCSQARTQFQAQEMCSYLFSTDLAKLSEPGSNSEAAKLRRSLTNGPNYSAWIGATDSDNEAYFQWQDGEPLSVPTFWFNGEPNNYGDGQDCAVMWQGSSRWDDQACDELFYAFFCNARTTPSPTSRPTPHPTPYPTSRPTQSPVDGPTTRAPTTRPTAPTAPTWNSGNWWGGNFGRN